MAYPSHPTSRQVPSARGKVIFVLSENSIYKAEAWEIFLDRLTDPGVSRWYLRDNPTEMYRLTSLASVALKLDGVEDIPADTLSS